MLGFPKPYPNELIYSTLARAGSHSGETSPKRFLDAVFDNRCIIATTDLPNHIRSISNQYPETLGLTCNEILNSHTLWPLYYPFISYERRISIEAQMCEGFSNTAHLASGQAASRIKHKQSLFICPECTYEQQNKYGEAYWDRRWQIPLIKTCPKHGPLYQTSISINNIHRHQFIVVSDAKIEKQCVASNSDRRLSYLAQDLLSATPLNSPTLSQWSQFYNGFAFESGYQLGKRIDHQAINSQYLKYWGESWLEQQKLLPTEKDTSWLKSIFRKHRHSFSFIEHLTVIDALSSGRLGIKEVMHKAVAYPLESKPQPKVISAKDNYIGKDQLDWLSLMKSHNPKSARQKSPALYARLYRGHYSWLMQINVKHRIKKEHVDYRVNWQERDRKFAKELLRLTLSLENDLSLPRLSKSYLLHQLSMSATVEKNLYRLPRCRVVLEKYSENKIEYQARRLFRAVISLKSQGKIIKEWLLLREAGLSQDRIDGVIKDFIEDIIKNAQ